MTKQKENKMVGKKDTPPRRGIAFVCTFRASGISYNFFFIDISRILGISIHARNAEITKAEVTKR